MPLGFNPSQKYWGTNLGGPRYETPSLNDGEYILENWEWCYFGDIETKRAFFLVHHEDDLIPDYYRPMDGMTVFGYGRTGKATENLTSVPQNFTIGFCEDTTYQAVSGKIRKIVKQAGRH